jgi:hypothetical protein
MTFLQAVAQVLTIGGLLRGDTQAPTSFSQTQFGSSMPLAQIAIKSTLGNITAIWDFPEEKVDATLTMVAGQRIYQLPTDFDEFWTTEPFFYDSVQNNIITQFNGGERKLAIEILDYKTETGYPNEFYEVEGNTKQIGFYQIPDSSVDGRVLNYSYEKDVMVYSETDTLPFISQKESEKFCELAAVKFNALYTQQPRMPGVDTERDPQYVAQLSTLLRMINPIKPPKLYGRKYNPIR